MIAGVDHLALSCGSIGATVAEFGALGFAVSFRESDIDNPLAKRRYLHRAAVRHSLAYLKPSTGTAVELTVHGPPVADDRPPAYEPLFSGRVELAPTPPADREPAPAELAVLTAATGWNDVRRSELASTAAALWHDPAAPSEQPVTLGAVAIHVCDVKAAAHFWESALGAMATRDGSGRGLRWKLLAFRPVVPAWALEVLVIERADEARHGTMLDSAGWPCLALVSTALEADLDRLRAHGAIDDTGPFELTVNGNRIRVAVARSPTGELVELIEPVRPRYRDVRSGSGQVRLAPHADLLRGCDAAPDR